MTKEFRDIGKEVSNWGRWGKEDRVGTLNHITPARVAAAAHGVKTGRIIQLGLPIRANGPQTGNWGRINPVHLMSVTPNDAPTGSNILFADDFIFMPLQSVTQWDGLAHVGYDGMLYNGIPAGTVGCATGSTELSIDQIAQRGVAGRGVLLDIARLRGVERLRAGEEITIKDLEAAEARQKIRVEAGDILILRTGWMRNYTVDNNVPAYWDGEPGVTVDCVRWLHERQVAAIASDNWGVEVFPRGMNEVSAPFHAVAIRDMGMTLGELFVLDDLADACEKAGAWSFFFSCPPLLVVGGVGSPITPLAIL